MLDDGQNLAVLCGASALIGLLHTLLGPDHYVPFVAMSRAGGWSRHKTLLITLLCGIGHVLSSVALGLIGIALGIAVFKIEAIESFRGRLAGWLMLAFGMVYFVYGVRRAIRGRPHTHRHAHMDGTIHEHEHAHTAEHVHVHGAGANGDARDPRNPESAESASITPWVLFTIFVFGPCEPLIPLVMYPAAKGELWPVAAVTVVFGLVTLATMTAVVMLACSTIRPVKMARWERYHHAAAGLIVLACGAAMTAGL